eukprot:Gregarina_sp_Poly_1__11147@NODE_905_length_5764_cov_9_157627_g645_i0_p3_GENE_NODE_905_length_5764_cov_9_157627_g645_i0NODE_905_length_5764_cov_9_157627_g645_i0_p3_ORF_typecomplete_len358_score27_91Glyco_hydro_19/PF00182_19/1_2e31UCH/PF00443_29/0_12_NODE_905_length_5764_cov_9_157627_g645_i029894062
MKLASVVACSVFCIRGDIPYPGQENPAPDEWFTECPPDMQDPLGPIVDRSKLRHRSGIERLITRNAFEQLFSGRHKYQTSCQNGRRAFHYDSLIRASKFFPEFANTGNEQQDAMELAAFLATCSHETTGAAEVAPCGRDYWGLCFVREFSCDIIGCPAYAQQDTCEDFPCPSTPGQEYYGRGAIQLSYNYNYAFFSKVMYDDPQVLLDDADRVAQIGTLAWASGLFFWMTEQRPKDSCHQVITGKRTYLKPSQTGGFGLATLIINGGAECSGASCQEDPKSAGRIQYFKRYAFLLDAPLCRRPNDVLKCARMMPYPFPNDTNAPGCRKPSTRAYVFPFIQRLITTTAKNRISRRVQI